MAYAFTATVHSDPVEERLARPSFFSRVIAAMVESRMRAVARELNARQHLLNGNDLVLGGTNRTTLATDRAMPFTR